jgi:hypothetical protein
MNDRELHRGSLAAGLVFVIIGIAFLLEALDVWDIEPEVLWPSVLIAIGAALLIGAPIERKPPPPPPDTSGL